MATGPGEGPTAAAFPHSLAGDPASAYVNWQETVNWYSKETKKASPVTTGRRGMREFPVHVYYEKVVGTFWELLGAQDDTTRSLTACTAGERRKPQASHPSTARPPCSSSQLKHLPLHRSWSYPCHAAERQKFSHDFECISLCVATADFILSFSYSLM